MTTRRKTTTGRSVTKGTVVAVPATSTKHRTNAARGRARAVRARSIAEVSARLDLTDRTIRRVTHSAVGAMRGSMSDAVTAAKTVRVSFRQAVAAVRRASRGIARRLTVAARSMTVAAVPATRASATGRRSAAKH